MDKAAHLAESLGKLGFLFSRADNQLPVRSPQLVNERFALNGLAEGKKSEVTANSKPGAGDDWGMRVGSEYHRISSALNDLLGVVLSREPAWLHKERKLILLTNAPAILERCAYLLRNDEALITLTDSLIKDDAPKKAALCDEARHILETHILPAYGIESSIHTEDRWSQKMGAFRNPAAPSK